MDAKTNTFARIANEDPTAALNLARAFVVAHALSDIWAACRMHTWMQGDPPKHYISSWLNGKYFSRTWTQPDEYRQLRDEAWEFVEETDNGRNFGAVP